MDTRYREWNIVEAIVGGGFSAKLLGDCAGFGTMIDCFCYDGGRPKYSLSAELAMC